MFSPVESLSTTRVQLVHKRWLLSGKDGGSTQAVFSPSSFVTNLNTAGPQASSRYSTSSVPRLKSSLSTLSTLPIKTTKNINRLLNVSKEER